MGIPELGGITFDGLNQAIEAVAEKKGKLQLALIVKKIRDQTGEALKPKTDYAVAKALAQKLQCLPEDKRVPLVGAFKKWEGYAASNTGTRVVVEVAAHELQAETSKVPGWVRRLGITITEGWNTVKMFCAGRREGNRLAQIEKTFDMWVAENDSQASALAADSTETKEDPSSRGELSVFEEKKPGAEGMGDLLASSDCEAQVIEIHGEERGKKKGPPPPPISAFRAGQTQKAGVTETGKSRPLTKRPEHEGQGVAAGKKKVPPPTPPKNYPVAHKTGGLGAQEVEGRPIVTKVPWSRGKGKPESPPPDEEVSEDDAWSD